MATSWTVESTAGVFGVVDTDVSVGMRGTITSIVIVAAVGSRSAPPFAVPPSSCTWNVKVA
jgi:hypothetical protein